MEKASTRRLACAVCGGESYGHENWFLLIEDHWLDRLKILTWHFSLAMQTGVKSACCREHLKTLIAHWLEEASLRLRPETVVSSPPAVPPQAEPAAERKPQYLGRLLGELSVFRESFSRVWLGSPETLECIVEALIPFAPHNEADGMDAELVSAAQQSTHQLTLIKAPAGRQDLAQV
ncbi:MAG: hypothetical protein WBQ72_15165 [Terriglobales bacterium]|jgi:hypothetical protein